MTIYETAVRKIGEVEAHGDDFILVTCGERDAKITANASEAQSYAVGSCLVMESLRGKPKHVQMRVLNDLVKTILGDDFIAE